MFKKLIYSFLKTVFMFTAMMTILFPVTLYAISFALQFFPRYQETVNAIRMPGAAIEYAIFGATLGLLMGCGYGFLLNILPAVFGVIKRGRGQ